MTCFSMSASGLPARLRAAVIGTAPPADAGAASMPLCWRSWLVFLHHAHVIERPSREDQHLVGDEGITDEGVCLAVLDPLDSAFDLVWRRDDGRRGGMSMLSISAPSTNANSAATSVMIS